MVALSCPRKSLGGLVPCLAASAGGSEPAAAHLPTEGPARGTDRHVALQGTESRELPEPTSLRRAQLARASVTQIPRPGRHGSRAPHNCLGARTHAGEISALCPW